MEPKIIGERIKNLIKEKKVTKEYVAKRIGITNKKLENKLEGKEEFYISEIIELTKIFNLKIEECAKIFFNEDKFI
ncbi:MAG: helix-turn-helix domain-containing protein [Clostridia bacterium]